MENKAYIIVNIANGSILRSGGCLFDKGEWLVDVPEGYEVKENLEGALSGMHRIEDGALVEMDRLDNIIIMDRVGDTITFTNIPQNTLCSTYGAGLRTQVTPTDGILEYEANNKGTHLFRFDNPLYIRWADVRQEIL
jgi:hypothetical protein